MSAALDRAYLSAAITRACNGCETHSRGYCRSSECVDAENALYAAVRDELEAHKVALAELRKLAESNAVAAPPRDKTVLFDGEFRPSAEWQELAEKTR